MPGRKRVLVVDDEQPARELLRAHVSRRPELELIAEAADGEEAVRLVGEREPDLVLLDIQMPGLDGFGVLAEVRRRGDAAPRFVFATAFDAYAVRAFEVNALDYLLKPISRARFDLAIDRFLAAGRPGPEVEASHRGLLEDAMRARPRRILVRARGRIVPVPIEEVEWLEAADDYVRIHVGDREYLVERSLRELEVALAPLGFARIHRGAVVRLDRIREISPEGSGRYRVVLASGATLVASRGYSRIFRGDLL